MAKRNASLLPNPFADPVPTGSVVTSSHNNLNNDEMLPPECKVRKTPVCMDLASKMENKGQTLMSIPPPSTSLSEMYVDPAKDFVDDQTLHSGRVRSFPHERGNWSTYVYVPYDVSADLKDQLDHFVSTISWEHELKPCEDLHISLSKTIIMRHHWIESFAETLRKRMESIRRFYICAVQLEAYMNEEKTRTFLGIKVEGKELLSLVSIVHESLSKFRLSSFYEDPSFHMSIGWCLGDRWLELKESLPRIQELFDNTFDEDSLLFCAVARSICCKTGNRIYNFQFGEQ